MNPLELQVLAILSRVAHDALMAGGDRQNTRGDSTAATFSEGRQPLEPPPVYRRTFPVRPS